METSPCLGSTVDMSAKRQNENDGPYMQCCVCGDPISSGTPCATNDEQIACWDCWCRNGVNLRRGILTNTPGSTIVVSRFWRWCNYGWIDKTRKTTRKGGEDNETEAD